MNEDQIQVPIAHSSRLPFVSGFGWEKNKLENHSFSFQFGETTSNDD